MSSRTHRIVAFGLVTLPLLGGCVGEETDQQANFPRAVGTDDNRVSQGALPEDLPTEETAMDGVPEPSTPGNTDPGDEDGYADTDPSALTDFRGALDDHGQWVEDPNYGTMWQPSQAEVGTDFAPYVSGGHWGYDDSNYVWVSDYSWGWAPYHYGRWAYGSYGWGWIPGRTYAPAWATWRTGYPGYGYVGWAPLPPTWYWGPGGVALGLGRVPSAPYAFCGTGGLFAGNLRGSIVTAPSSVQSIASQTHPYTTASGGTLGGHVGANPTIAGPSPQSLNIPNGQINHVSAANPQLSRALSFAHPSTAMALGAHGPAVGGHLGPLASSSNLASNHVPNAGASSHAMAGAPFHAPMRSYGAPSRSYYNNRTSTSIGSAYGHGSSMRAYGPSGGAPHLNGGYHPTYTPPEGTSVPHISSSHYGGHYGGGGHGGHR